MKNGNKKDKKVNSGPIKNQWTVGDTDRNNSDGIIDDTGITADLDLKKMW